MKPKKPDLIVKYSENGPAQHAAYGKPPCPPPNTRTEVVDGMRILRDALVPMRDGISIYADVYLPQDPRQDGQLGAIVGWGAFGKHAVTDKLPEPMEVLPGMISRHTGWEVADPVYWTQHGYAVIYPDPRGSWNSPGTYHLFGDEESLDAYDLCEWAGTQPWSNGKVAFMGVSYPGCASWQVAARRPPHLAAIVPWEAWTDGYREFAYHGGIRETGHTALVDKVMQWPKKHVESMGANFDAHPFDDDFWAYKNADIEAVEVPILVGASWTDQGLHNRGTLRGFRRASSKHKWLFVHGGKKWAEFYRKENVERQRAFFDRFLLGREDAFQDQPPVQIEVRERAKVRTLRAEQEWPLARTQYTPLYLDMRQHTLSRQPVAQAGSTSYVADTVPENPDRATFDLRFDEDTELTGTMKLKLWVEAKGSDDLDLFVAVQKLDTHGERVDFAFFSTHWEGPVALGWLRASHRELDAARSTPGEPVHLHKREQKLSPGEIVPVEIEVWPSSTLFRAGESLRVVVQAQDIYVFDDMAQNRHFELRNHGRHVLHGGGPYDSHLLVPVIPAKP